MQHTYIPNLLVCDQRSTTVAWKASDEVLAKFECWWGSQKDCPPPAVREMSTVPQHKQPNKQPTVNIMHGWNYA